MKVQIYNKLVRDKIASIILQSGQVAVTRKADEEEFAMRLHIKLAEEVTEFMKSGDPAELVDVFEVLMGLCEIYGWDMADLKRFAAKKREEKGGFEERTVLISVLDYGTPGKGKERGR